MEFWTDQAGLSRLCYDLYQSPLDFRLKVTLATETVRGFRIRVKLSKRQVRRLMATPSRFDIEKMYGA